MKVSDLRARKRELGFSNKMISEMSGVPLSTVVKIFSGATESPRYETLRLIENALYSKGAEVMSRPSDYTNVDFNSYKVSVNETAAEYAYDAFYSYDSEFMFQGKRQGQFTTYDYEALPYGLRMELIDGVLYDMAPPTTVHQTIVARVAMPIMQALDNSKGDCMLFVSPVSVQFDINDDRNSFEPDLVIVCDKSKYQNEKGRIYGAPDWVMEVLSPSTRGKDLVLKFNKYWDKGVREYWIVDPQSKEITVYCFEKGTPPSHYSFEDTIPISVFDGKLSIDFGSVLEFLRERLDF